MRTPKSNHVPEIVQQSRFVHFPPLGVTVLVVATNRSLPTSKAFLVSAAFARNGSRSGNDQFSRRQGRLNAGIKVARCLFGRSGTDIPHVVEITLGQEYTAADISRSIQAAFGLGGSLATLSREEQWGLIARTVTSPDFATHVESVRAAHRARIAAAAAENAVSP